MQNKVKAILIVIGILTRDIATFGDLLQTMLAQAVSQESFTSLLR